jgi:hypothetical protein
MTIRVSLKHIQIRLGHHQCFTASYKSGSATLEGEEK